MPLATNPNGTDRVILVEVVSDARGKVTYNPVEADDLLTLTEVADFFGVSRQRASQLSRRPDFPPAAITTKLGSCWTRADIEAYDAVRAPRLKHLGVPKRDRITA